MKVELIASCASDLDVVNAARVSFAQQSELEEVRVDSGSVIGHKLSERDAGLIRFLARNRHGTPFEHGFFKFHVDAPIFIFREWHRHRVGHSYNEMSGRYVELEERFYWPDAWRVQKGKPGAYTFEPVAPDWEFNDYALEIMADSYHHAWKVYRELMALGVAKEQARAVLPVGIYSQMIWSCNPRSLMHFCSLRNAPNAMKEIRDLAAQVEEEFKRIMPVTADAFIENGRVAP